MSSKFDQLTKSLAQSVTRRGAFKQFGVGLAGMVLALVMPASNAEAGSTTCLPGGYTCKSNGDCCSGLCQPANGKISFTTQKKVCANV